MNDMLKPRTMFFVVATLMAVLVGLAGGWLTTLPRHIMAHLKQQLASDQNLLLDARNPRFGYDKGVVLRLDSVSISGPAGSAAIANAQGLVVPLGFPALFGSAMGGHGLILESAAIDLDLTRKGATITLPTRHVVLRDATVRLRDRNVNAVVTLADVNGTLQTTEMGGASASLTFMLNDVFTRLEGHVEDASRLATIGSPADLTLATGDKLVSFSGRARMADGLMLDGHLNADAVELSSFLAWLGLPLRSLSPAGHLRLSTGFSSSGLKAELLNLVGQAGGSDFSGGGTLDAGPERPRLVVNLDVPRLDVWRNSGDTPVLSKPWSEAPLAVSDLRAFDGRLAVKTDVLRLRGLDLGIQDITFKAEAGKMQIETTGDVASTFTLTARGNHLVSDISLEAANAGIVMRSVLGLDAIANPARLTLNIASEGQHLAGHVSTMRGMIALNGENIRLTGVDPPALLKAAGQGWRRSSDRTAEVARLSLNATLLEGVATLSKSALETSTFSARPEGEIDLLRQAFDVKLNPTGKDVAPMLELKGNWSHPLFVVDAGKAPAMRPTSLTKHAPSAPAD